MPHMHIGLNAHLLSSQAGYRAAGIHGYIYNTLAHLAAEAPSDWRFTALVGAASAADGLPGIALRRSRWDTQPPLRRIAWEQAVQPWHIGGFDLYHALAFVAPLALPAPLVVTVYDLSFLHYPQALSASRRAYLRLFTRLTCQRARRVICISHSTAQDVIERLGVAPEKVDVAAAGHDPARFRPLPPGEIAVFRREKDLPERFWLFVGTLEPRKNLPTLLQAYAALPARQRPPLLLGGGKGWDYDAIFAAIARLGLADSVRWLGFLAADELAHWYNCAEIFVYPSVFEGFGLPVLEAMACGTPVVVADASSLPEVAGDAGLCVPPHDVRAWTDALHRAMTDAVWRTQAAERGLAQASRYTWQDTARQTIRSYACALD
jgi:glycosyltransferase involved in cell wall biosynthesis